jgi:Skp family chaperone for outer membrane proteins
MKRMFTACAAILLLSQSGCNMLSPRQSEADILREQQVLREREQRKFYEEQYRKSQQGMEDTQGELYRMQQELARLRKDLTEAQSSDAQKFDRRIGQLETAVRELEQRRKQDRDEIIDILSKRMAEVVQAQSAQAARQTSRSSGGGQEHIVGRGETLSAIAAAYEVSSQAIIQANNLSNPNSLRVGQKLIIPR